MITPLFSISQTSRQLHVKVRAPHSRPKDIDVRADGHDFHFYSSPYLLHLRFEHPLNLSQASPTYDMDTGIAIVTLDKQQPYPHFSRLDMLSTLLVTRTPERKPPSIEVISSSTTTQQVSEESVKQLQTSTPSGLCLPMRELSIARPKYGFGSRYEGVFAARAEDVSNVVELDMPDTVPVWRRKSLRKAKEDKKFCADHYMADFLLAHEFEHVLEYQVEFRDIEEELREEWIQTLILLPKREYLRDVDREASANLAGLLFAIMYDRRTTLGEGNVESAWTISRLCASMSFLEQFQNVQESIVASFGRSLAYPLYRHVGLSQRVLQDVKSAVNLETVEDLRKRLLRILLEVREVFEGEKLLRLHSDLWLTDYCIWVQSVDAEVLKEFRDKLKQVQVEKGDMEWGLEELEQRAKRMKSGEEGAGLEPVNVDKRRQNGIDRKGLQSEITISALSPFPSPGLAMKPIASRRIHAEEDSSYEYTSATSSYDSSCSSDT